MLSSRTFFMVNNASAYRASHVWLDGSNQNLDLMLHRSACEKPRLKALLKFPPAAGRYFDHRPYFDARVMPESIDRSENENQIVKLAILLQSHC